MTQQEKDQIRKLAESKFKELGFKDHDWGNFLSGFIAGIEYAYEKLDNKG